MLDLCYNTQNILHHSAIRIEATRSRRPFSPILLACRGSPDRDLTFSVSNRLFYEEIALDELVGPFTGFPESLPQFLLEAS
jgi:hypothetical protein